ncbi:hypothetical protein EDB84DRAFT_1447300 [Lactarius hengduanensis]|nr:hypothetical protein EDB84DRAFT_1447300 [Lactarius hengduanensis]
MGTHEGTWLLPSHSYRSGAHEGTPPARSPPPSLLSAPPPFARKGACEGNAPSRGTPFAWEGAHEAKPSPPPRCAAGPPRRKGKPAPHLQPAPVAPPSLRPPPPPSFAQTGSRRDTPPPLPTRARKRGDSAPTMSLGAGDASPAPHHPRTQGEGWHAHPVPSARATLAPPHAHHTAPPVHARGGVGVQPLRTGHSSPVFMRPTIPTDTGGLVRPAQPLPRRVHLPVDAQEEARVRGPHASTHTREGSRNEGWYNLGGRTEGPHKGCAGKASRGATRVPGGAACERRGVRIRAEVRKGEGEGEGDGGGVVNGAKRSWGEAAHADSGTPRASRLT